MNRRSAALGSAVFLLVAPGTVAGFVPWWITRWRPSEPHAVLQAVGVVMIVVGAAVVLLAFARFARDGIGTPAPVAPTQRLVVGGAYRHVRNPMYLAVFSVIVGQAALLGRIELVWYAAAFLVATASFVRFYEEPTLRGRYGAEYDRYTTAVRGWWPRWRPHRQPSSGGEVDVRR